MPPFFIAIGLWLHRQFSLPSMANQRGRLSYAAGLDNNELRLCEHRSFGKKVLMFAVNLKQTFFQCPNAIFACMVIRFFEYILPASLVK